MAVTQNSYTGDGSTRNFTFTFNYLDRSHVKAKVNNVVTTAFTFNGASTLNFNTAPGAGIPVLIYRETPSDALLADYTPGTAIRESDLETSLRQVLFVSQETQTLAENLSTGGLQSQIDGLNSAVLAAQSTADLASSKADSALDRSGGYINKIINGEFDIIDRANGGSATGWIFDRWRADIVGSAATFTRTAAFVSDPVESGLPVGVRRYVKAAITSVLGSGNYVRFRQPIENARSFTGRVVNVSFWARSASPTQISVNFTQKFGTGGSPSAAVDTTAEKFSLTSTWQRFSAVISIPSVIGKSFGTNNDSALDFNIWLEAGSNFNTQTNSLGQASKTVDITRLQVIAGSTLCDWEGRSQGEERLFCQRYWERIDVAVAGYHQSGGTSAFSFPYKVTKRRTPDVSVTGESFSELNATTPRNFLATVDSVASAFYKNTSAGEWTYSSTIISDAELP